METEVKELAAKAAKAEYARDALQFSQAANNIANTMCALASEKTIKPKE